jgi:uncharacterized phage-like protein YoqJ
MKCEGGEGLIWAATGHRPDKLGGYSDDAQHKLIVLACKFLIESKPSRVITGMALGWDTAIAEACVRFNVPFIAAVPFEGQEQRWPEAAQARYRILLNWAERIQIVSSGGYSVSAMHARNRWMVDTAHAVVALWDGTPSGTANCIDYARRAEKEVLNLWDAFFR